MRDFKLKMRGKPSWIARHFARTRSFFGRVRKHLVENPAAAALRSRFRRGESRVAHAVGVPVAEFDARRRAFLKYAFFGGAVLVAGKYINPLVNLIRGDTVLSERTFENFKITETGRRLLVTDDDGGEILTIDKESF